MKKEKRNTIHWNDRVLMKCASEKPPFGGPCSPHTSSCPSVSTRIETLCHSAWTRKTRAIELNDRDKGHTEFVPKYLCSWPDTLRPRIAILSLCSTVCSEPQASGERKKTNNILQIQLKPYADYKSEIALETWQRPESALEGTFQHFWRWLVCPIAADKMITFQSNPAEALWKESSDSAAQGMKQAGQ